MEYFCMTRTPNLGEGGKSPDVNHGETSSGNCLNGIGKVSKQDTVTETAFLHGFVSESTSNFIPPTNQASVTQRHSGIHMMYHRPPVKINQSNTSEECKTSESLPLLRDRHSHSPCLVVSKGSIKKMAQTRFVNSSPRSYRLMPASVESSDMTSFVEKSPHKYAQRVSFMLRVAELWELSKHSELESLFTFANSDKEPRREQIVEDAKQKRPICHSAVVPAHVPCPWRASAPYRESSEYLDFADELNIKESAVNTGIDTDLLRHVKRFLRSQKLKEKHPMGIAGFINSPKSPSKLFPHHRASSSLRGKHKLRSKELEDPANDSLTPLVKLLTVNGPNDASTSKDGQVFIIHIPPVEAPIENSASDKYDEPPTKRSRATDNMLDADGCTTPPVEEQPSDSKQKKPEDSDLTLLIGKGKYECFYCDHVYSNKNDCARHMLIHLAADSRHAGANNLPSCSF